VGVIVNVGPVHVELLGSVEAIAAAKAELIAGMRPGATAVVPAHEELLRPHLRDDVEVVTFGEGGDVSLVRKKGQSPFSHAMAAGAGGQKGQTPLSGVVIDAEGERIEVEGPFSAAYQRLNLLAAVAAARALGVTPQGRIEVAFSALRGERIELPNGVTIVNDCYNANPMSMRAALDDLAETAPARRVAVLGDMLELGPEAEDYHREVGTRAAEDGVAMLVTVGPLAARMADRFDGEVHSVATAAEAAVLLPGLLRPADTVLVKGSRGVGLEIVAEALSRRRAPAPIGSDPTTTPPEAAA
jgi:UDP-N-acetylmuramoyl-tripeptide--D-alanyl-D-alanine ligase